MGNSTGLSIRSAAWPQDEKDIQRIDTSFDSETIYVVSHDGLSFVLTEEAVVPRYQRPMHQFDLNDLQDADALFVAEVDERVVGIGGLRCDQWNRRAVVANIYVDRGSRGRGAGHGLMHAIAGAAETSGMNRLWIETQNVNVPAVRFYLKEGFSLCGLDQSFYDPSTPAGAETALFFVKAIP